MNLLSNFFRVLFYAVNWIRAAKRKIRQIEKINNRKEYIHSLTRDWIKGIKHKLNTDLKKTLHQLKPLSVWVSIKINQLYMCVKVGFR